MGWDESGDGFWDSGDQLEESTFAEDKKGGPDIRSVPMHVTLILPF